MAKLLSIKGKVCGPCFRTGKQTPATQKVEQVLPEGENRHPYTQYICDEHFAALMGPWVLGPEPEAHGNPRA